MPSQEENIERFKNHIHNLSTMANEVAKGELSAGPVHLDEMRVETKTRDNGDFNAQRSGYIQRWREIDIRMTVRFSETIEALSSEVE